jgi:hypothetical protein
MNRTDALEYLNSQPGFSAFALDTGLIPADQPDGYKVVIDSALLDLGVDYVALPAIVVDNMYAADFRALLRYHALLTFADLYALRVDVNLGTAGLSKQRSQAYKAVKDRLDEARKEVESRGYGVSGGELQLGRMTLDFLEPASEWGV